MPLSTSEGYALSIDYVMFQASFSTYSVPSILFNVITIFFVKLHAFRNTHLKRGAYSFLKTVALYAGSLLQAKHRSSLEPVKLKIMEAM